MHQRTTDAPAGVVLPRRCCTSTRAVVLDTLMSGGLFGIRGPHQQDLQLVDYAGQSSTIQPAPRSSRRGSTESPEQQAASTISGQPGGMFRNTTASALPLRSSSWSTAIRVALARGQGPQFSHIATTLTPALSACSSRLGQGDRV